MFLKFFMLSVYYLQIVSLSIKKEIYIFSSYFHSSDRGLRWWFHECASKTSFGYIYYIYILSLAI